MGRVDFAEICENFFENPVRRVFLARLNPLGDGCQPPPANVARTLVPGATSDKCLHPRTKARAESLQGVPGDRDPPDAASIADCSIARGVLPGTGQVFAEYAMGVHAQRLTGR